MRQVWYVNGMRIAAYEAVMFVFCAGVVAGLVLLACEAEAPPSAETAPSASVAASPAPSAVPSAAPSVAPSASVKP